MTALDPRLLLTALVVVWSLVLLVVIALGLVHAGRATASRRRERLDARARPLVIRFALAEEEDTALAGTLRDARGGFGDRVDERLLSILETLRGKARARIVTMLVERGHPARLRRRARARRTTTRAAALRRLGQLALPADAELVRRSVSDRAPIVRTVAVRAVASYASADSVEVVLDQLRGSGEVPSLVVVTSLIEQGSTSAEALGAIRAGLGDPRATVRAACARVLGELTSAADAARLGLLLQRDATPSVQLAAASALERVARTSSVPALLEGTRSPWGPVRTHSLQALLSLPREVTDEALTEVARRGDALLAPLLPPRDHTPRS
ncbi:hypothetical protein [Brachybacterium vulturis]|uniref:hypothetical protein n=1 Tax=Brachybacterium vulturis TaxID=2017484 RepID=UPI0037368C82